MSTCSSLTSLFLQARVYLYPLWYIYIDVQKLSSPLFLWGTPSRGCLRVWLAPSSGPSVVGSPVYGDGVCVVWVGVKVKLKNYGEAIVSAFWTLVHKTCGRRGYKTWANIGQAIAGAARAAPLVLMHGDHVCVCNTTYILCFIQYP